MPTGIVRQHRRGELSLDGLLCTGKEKDITLNIVGVPVKTGAQWELHDTPISNCDPVPRRYVIGLPAVVISPLRSTGSPIKGKQYFAIRRWHFERAWHDKEGRTSGTGHFLFESRRYQGPGGSSPGILRVDGDIAWHKITKNIQPPIGRWVWMILNRR